MPEGELVQVPATQTVPAPHSGSQGIEGSPPAPEEVGPLPPEEDPVGSPEEDPVGLPDEVEGAPPLPAPSPGRGSLVPHAATKASAVRGVMTKRRGRFVLRCCRMVVNAMSTRCTSFIQRRRKQGFWAVWRGNGGGPAIAVREAEVIYGIT